jgi:predicted amidophosphoribosyltransferase
METAQSRGLIPCYHYALDFGSDDECGSCGEDTEVSWNYCPHCGEEL